LGASGTSAGPGYPLQFLSPPEEPVVAEAQQTAGRACGISDSIPCAWLCDTVSPVNPQKGKPPEAGYKQSSRFFSKILKKVPKTLDIFFKFW
jgi:hypothetical protein